MITADSTIRLPEATRRPRREGLRWRLWFGLRSHVLAWVAITFLLTAAGAAILAPAIAPHEPTAMDQLQRFAGPTAEHPFGTDEFGRDTLSRLIYGGRISLTVGISSVVGAMLVGLPLGLAAGFFDRLDNPIMRVMDVVLTFPDILLAIAIMVALGPTVRNVMIAIAIINVPIFARITRSLVLGARQLPYVEAARTLGCTDTLIIGRHILPNVLSPIVVQATLSLGFAILTEAALSFLGLGTQPPTPSWGLMLNTARNYMEYSPWIAVFPGLAIFLTVFSFNILGDFLRDVLDPRLSERLRLMYLRVTINTIERGKSEDLRTMIEEMTRHRERGGYVPVEWLTSLTGASDELVSVQRYERLADYEASLEQIGQDPAYRALLERLKACTVPGTGRVQLFRTWT